MKTREAMVTKITLVTRLQKLVERLPSQGQTLITLARFCYTMVLLKFVEEILSQITSQSRPNGITGNAGTFVKITSIRYGL